MPQVGLEATQLQSSLQNIEQLSKKTNTHASF